MSCGVSETVGRVRGQHAQKAVSIIPKHNGQPGSRRREKRMVGVSNEAVVIGRMSSHDNTIFFVAFSGVSVPPEHTGRPALLR